MERVLRPQPLTAQRLREVLQYDQATGVFTWLIDSGSRNGPKIGKKAGSKWVSFGWIGGGVHQTSRLAVLYITGEWPTGYVTSGKPRTDSQSRVCGAYFRKDRVAAPWQAMVRTNGKVRHLGYFSTKEAAGEAHLAAKRISTGSVDSRNF